MLKRERGAGELVTLRGNTFHEGGSMLVPVLIAGAADVLLAHGLADEVSILCAVFNVVAGCRERKRWESAASVTKWTPHTTADLQETESELAFRGLERLR
jgi:hypothetical protein